MYRNSPDDLKFESARLQDQFYETFTGKKLVKSCVVCFLLLQFVCFLVLCMFIERKRNEATANNHNMNITFTCHLSTKPSGPMMPTKQVAASYNTPLYMTANCSVVTAFINKSFHKNEFTNVSCTKSGDTTSSLPSSSMFENITIVRNNTDRNAFDTDTFFTQQSKATQSISCGTHHKSKTDITSPLNNLTISSEGCTGCHFTHQDFVNHVNNQSTHKSYFHGDDVTDFLQKIQLRGIKIPTSPPSFNIKEGSIVSDGYCRVGNFKFDKVLKLCDENMSKQMYGVYFGSVVKFRMNIKDNRFPIRFAPILIKFTTSKTNSSSSDQFSKCTATKMNSYQKSNHLIGIKIKPDTVTTLNDRSAANLKIGFYFDESLADGRVVWQYACIDHLQEKKCYRIACKDGSRTKRQDNKWVKRNHILSVQTEKRNSSYIPILLLKKDEQLAKTIAKIQSRIYFKHLPNCLCELFVTIE